MAQTDGDRLNFRELNQHGNPTDYRAEDHTRPDPRSGSGPIDGLTVNPFIIALWVLAAGLVIAGFGMFAGAQTSLSTGPVNGESMPLGYMWMSFAPNVLLAGVVSSLGLLFWHAAHWQRRNAK